MMQFLSECRPRRWVPCCRPGSPAGLRQSVNKAPPTWGSRRPSESRYRFTRRLPAATTVIFERLLCVNSRFSSVVMTQFLSECRPRRWVPYCRPGSPAGLRQSVSKAPPTWGSRRPSESRYRFTRRLPAATTVIFERLLCVKSRFSSVVMTQFLSECRPRRWVPYCRPGSPAGLRQSVSKAPPTWWLPPSNRVPVSCH
jgi:hypothetical protein